MIGSLWSGLDCQLVNLTWCSYEWCHKWIRNCLPFQSAWALAHFIDHLSDYRRLLLWGMLCSVWKTLFLKTFYFTFTSKAMWMFCHDLIYWLYLFLCVICTFLWHIAISTKPNVRLNNCHGLQGPEDGRVETLLILGLSKVNFHP